MDKGKRGVPQPHMGDFIAEKMSQSRCTMFINVTSYKQLMIHLAFVITGRCVCMVPPAGQNGKDSM